MLKPFNIDMLKPIYQLKTVLGVFPALDKYILMQWLARGFIIYDQEQMYEVRDRGKRLYAGIDMVKMAVMNSLANTGLNLPSCARLTRLVANRCQERCAGIAPHTDEHICYYADWEGVWQCAMYYSETKPELVRTPHIYGVIQSDKIIDDVARRLYGYLDNEGML